VPSSSCELVVMIFLTEIFKYTTRAILDIASGLTLIIWKMLPDETQLQPLGEALSRRRAVVHVIGRELQRNSVKRA